MALLTTPTSWKIVAAIASLAFISAGETTTDRPIIQLKCTGANTVKVNETDQVFGISNYYATQPIKTDCEWHITTGSNSTVVAVNLGLISTREESVANCSSDSVKFYDGPSTNSSKIRVLCDAVVPGTLSSTNSELTIVYHSDGLHIKDFLFNFHCRAMTKPTESNDSCKNVSLVAKETEQYLLSPNYPNWYLSNMDCVWHITADLDSNVVWLEIHDIALEPHSLNCTTDYVKIYYGPSSVSGNFELFCYDIQKTYISTNSSMTVVFHSNEQNNYRGFNFTYTSQKLPVQPDSKPDHTALIIGCVTCGVGLIFLTITISFRTRSRAEKRKQRTLQNSSSHSATPEENSSSDISAFDNPQPVYGEMSDVIAE